MLHCTHMTLDQLLFTTFRQNSFVEAMQTNYKLKEKECHRYPGQGQQTYMLAILV